MVYLQHLVNEEGLQAQARLFPWRNGYLSRAFTRLKAAFARPKAEGGMGRPFSGRLYDLRHTAATALSRLPISDQILKQVMGWSRSSKMADVYIHLGASDIAQWAYSVTPQLLAP